MKKCILTVIFCSFAAFSGYSTIILWGDVNQNAVITDGNSTVYVDKFYGDTLENALFRIKILDNIFPNFVYPKFPGERFPGEWGDFFMDGPDGSGRKYVVWSHQFELPDDISNDSQLVMELGILDENDDFELIAVSDIFYYAEIKGKCTYETSGIEALYPGADIEFSPITFYTDIPIIIPEPSTIFLLALGACAILLKGRNGIHE